MKVLLILAVVAMVIAYVAAVPVFQTTMQKCLKPHTPWHRVHHAVPNKKASDDALLFPVDDPVGSAETSRSGLNIPDPQPCPDGQTFCDSAEDYPKEYIKDLLKKQAKTIHYVEEIVKKPASSDAVRFGGEGSESPICESMSTIIFPNKARSTEGLFEFIVNDDEGNKQGIKVETCVSNGQACNIPGTLPIGYSSVCKQQTIMRTLVVLDRNSPKGGAFISKPFEFPACCGCYIKNMSDRFGFRHVSQVNITSAAKKPTSRPKDLKT